MEAVAFDQEDCYLTPAEGILMLKMSIASFQNKTLLDLQKAISPL